MTTKNLAARLEKAVGLVAADLDEAREKWADWRSAYGRKRDGSAPLLTDPGGNVKIAKASLPSYSLALAAGKYGRFNVCPAAGMCEKSCLGKTAGRNVMVNAQSAQAMRTDFLAASPAHFLAVLADEIRRAVCARRRAVGPYARIGVRLNAYSDIAWERVAPWLFAEFSDSVQFYDYTKRDARSRRSVPNYHLTFSADERTTREQLLAHLDAGRNVAVVGKRRKGEPLPMSSVPIIDGDRTDSRWTDPAGVVVHLARKGNALDVGSPFLRDDLLA